MTAALDPRGAEPRALSAAVDFSDKRVLEIGAGDGRLTFRFAPDSRFAIGIEINTGVVVSASAAHAVHPKGRLAFLPACAMALPFRRRTFDVALLGWSL